MNHNKQTPSLWLSFEKLLYMLFALLILRLVPFGDFQLIPGLIYVVVVTLPIALFLGEYRLFSRRAVLETGTPEDGQGRKYLWRGTVTKVFILFSSFVIAILFLITVHDFEDRHWVAAILGAFALVTLEHLAGPLFGEETKGEFEGIALRRTAYWTVVISLIISMSIWDFYATPFPDIRGTDPFPLMEIEFDEGRNSFQMALPGVLYGALKAIDITTLYLAETYIPQFESIWMRALLWAVFLIKSAIQMSFLLVFLCGVSAVTWSANRRGWRFLGHSDEVRAFTITLVILASITGYLSIQIANYKPKDSTISVDQTQLNCDLDISKPSPQQLQKKQNELREQTSKLIATELDAVFAKAASGIDAYLDWHYSVKAEYQMLLAAASWRSAGSLEKAFEKPIKTALARTVLADFEDEVGSVGTETSHFLDDELAKIAKQLPRDVNQLRRPKCQLTLSQIETLPPNFNIKIGEPQATVAGTIAAAIILKKLAPKLAGKGIAKLLAKMAGGGTLALAALCGPAAPACAAGLAIITWFAVDYIAVTVDENLTRDDLKKEMLSDLTDQRNEIEGQLNDLFANEIDASFIKLGDFNISEQGMKNSSGSTHEN